MCWVLFHLKAFAPVFSFAGNAFLLCMINFFSTFCLCIKCHLLRELSPVPPTYTSLSFTRYYNLLFPYLLERITVCNYVIYWLFILSGPFLQWIALSKSLFHSSVTSGWASAGHTFPSIIVEPMNGSSGYSIISGFHFLLSSKQQLPCTHTGTLSLEELE